MLGSDVVTVRLLGDSHPKGAVAPATEPAHVWLPPRDIPPRESGAVYVGGSSAGSLYIYLAHSPDVFTITGEPDARRRLARAIAQQAAGAGHLVTAVGDAIGSHPQPRGVRFADRLESVRVADSDTVKMVICDPGADGDLAPLLALAKRDGRRPILVAVGDVPRGRWSADVWPDLVQIKRSPL